MGRRVLTAVFAVLVVGVVIFVGQAALTALPGDAWVHQEAPFGVVGVISVLAAGFAVRGSTGDSVPAHRSSE